jgi:hypothetical protein
MMMKKILQILSIALFFFLIGYALTYPYELSYHGSETVILLEDSYEKTSLEALIDREEFKGKVLYIRIWQPFWTEYKSYTMNELETMQSRLDSLKNDTTSEDYKTLSTEVQGRTLQYSSIEEQLIALDTISQKYKNSDIAFIYIADPYNSYPSRKDYLRKWKMAVKQHESPGYHLIMNPELANQVRQRIDSTYNGCYPRYLLANKQGKIINYEAAWPQDTVLLYPQINHLLAK